ncbi:8-oxo-dGTP diphosphatase [Actinoalloteichus hoggarensis]|uniref:Putative mutator protein MutT4 n=1 Tax=Actinoalloteichus hoggarensis TaxID=1470176 RepID=A0A221W9D8_9PSEU|nr:NUDIX hydrolase [Actinoalloteichus hoggarensis]ASO22354.1 Putative mutator protein MutT4 [Actinoalloteichus hoggarensis]MBB5923224.1 8-oxo-dGTP diphosphatase [Actinoalloteichus hoggarensis]
MAAAKDHGVRTAKHVRAAGVVLWRLGARSGTTVREVALVHRPRYDDWSLPKGKAEPGETRHATAVRETAEETGVRPVLDRLLGEVSYTLPAAGGEGLIRKTVTYYAARQVTDVVERPGDDEVDQVRWFSQAEAADRLTYPHDRVILRRFAELDGDSRTILLVRHAKAGSRAKWSQPDELRPLSRAGRRQSAALDRLLPLFAPSRVCSAPRTRCRQTVAGTAALLGLPVHDESALSEEAYAADPERARLRLMAMLDEATTTLVCSQGGVIPGLVRPLTDAVTGGDSAGVWNATPDDAEPPSKKGSLWVLSFHPTRPVLIGSEYLSSAEHW